MPRRRTNTKPDYRLYGDYGLRVVDACLVLCLFVAPLWFGGRHDLGRLLYATLVAAATLGWVTHCWLARKPFCRWSPLHGLCVAALGVVALQVIPLPQPILHHLSPALAELAPTWTPSSDFAVHLGTWRTLSVTPSGTTIGLAMLASHVLLLFVAVERLETLHDVQRLLKGIAAAAGFMAAFGLLQWVFSNGKLMWFYQHSQRNIGDSVQGAFANKNHFAHFVVLGVAAILAVLYTTHQQRPARQGKNKPLLSRSVQLGAWSATAIVACLAVVLSLSRGGVLALNAALVVGGLALLRGGLLGRTTAMNGAGLAALALLALSFGDVDRLSHRFDDLTSGSLEELDAHGGRQAIWSANLKAAQANPWFGYGVGSHEDVYHAFIESSFGTVFTHAESGYLHTLTETGWAGGAILLAAMAIVANWCRRGIMSASDPDHTLAWAAVSAGLTASAVHSFVDFVWYIPACMSVTVLLIACALSLHRLSRSAPLASGAAAPQEATPSHRPGAISTWICPAGGVLASIIAVSLLWGPGRASLAWDRYERASRVHRALTATELRRSPAADDPLYADLGWLQYQMQQSLEEVLRHDPRSARAHLALAGRRLQEFESDQRAAANAIGLPQLREAALASRFESRAATIAWMRKAFAESSDDLVAAHTHSRTALELAPLQGDGYTYLAMLNFLSPPQERDITALMDQAVRLRPRDGGVLVEAGKQAAFAGDAQLAVDYWKRAHQAPGSHRVAMITQLAARVPAEEYFKTFQPEQGLLWDIYRPYLKKNDRADLKVISAYTARLAEERANDRFEKRRRQSAWLLASTIERELGNLEMAARYAERAVELDPINYQTRRCLAAAYSLAERWEEAAPHARWCLVRRPGDKQLQRWLKEGEKARLAAGGLQSQELRYE